MSQARYSYAVLKYTHDVVSEETLNVGIVLLVSSLGYVRARVQHEYSRLSRAFEGFSGEYYRKVARYVESEINGLSDSWSGRLAFHDIPTDAKTLANTVLPDDDSSLRFSEARGGLTSDPEATLDALFERYVLRDQARPLDECRSVEEVWKVFRAPLQQRNVLPKLRPVTIVGSSFEYEFDHAYKNRKWHALEPVSMDAVHPQTLQDRATRWVGRAMDLREDERLEKLYLLVGPPQREELRASYAKAMDLLHKMPINHEIVLEQEADDLARSLQQIVEFHEREEQRGADG